MKKVMIVGCGAYMDAGYGCPGEWRCLNSAAEGAGRFDEAHQVVGFLRCQCPGRNIISNSVLMNKSSKLDADVLHFSSCLAGARPGCPYFDPKEVAGILEKKLGLPVVLGTHNYH